MRLLLITAALCASSYVNAECSSSDPTSALVIDMDSNSVSYGSTSNSGSTTGSGSTLSLGTALASENTLTSDLSSNSDSPTYRSSANKSAKIVLVGDSILEQNAKGTTRYSWSFPLQDKLNSTCAGDYEIVGKSRSPYTGYTGPSGYDLDRIAAGGFNTSGILNWMYSEPPAYGPTPPDYVVYYLGVNNALGGGWTTDALGYNQEVSDGGKMEWRNDTKEMIALARDVNPNVTFIIVLLQDMDGINASYKAKFDAINSVAASVAEYNSTANSPIYVTTQPKFNSADLYDGVHPVKSGATKIATSAYNVLFPRLNADGYCQ